MQAHTGTPRAETRRKNKKVCRIICFKREAIAQLCADLRDSRLCCFSAGACETLPLVTKQADETLVVPAGLEGLSTALLIASQYHHSVLTLAGLHRSARGKLVTSCILHPSMVTHIKGNLITAQRNGHSVTHNESRFESLEVSHSSWPTQRRKMVWMTTLYSRSQRDCNSDDELAPSKVKPSHTVTAG